MEGDTDSVTYFDDEDSTKEFFRLVDQQRRDKKFCDVVLIAEGTEFPVHRNILSASNVYFNKMFEPTSGFSESTLEHIEIREMKSSALGEIIEFCYKRKVNINEKNVQSLYAAAHFLQYKTIMEMCIPIISKQINNESCFDILQFAKLYDLIDLIDSVSAFIGNNFRQLIHKNEFRDLTCAELVYILNRTEIIFENEESIFEGIIIWVKAEQELREKHSIELIKLLKMNNLSTNYLTDVVTNEPLTNNDECHIMITEAYEFNTSFENKAICMESYDQELTFFNMEEQNWDILVNTSMSEDLDDESVVLDNKLYMLGCSWNYVDGSNPVVTNIVKMYDPKTNSWQSMCSMLHDRFGCKVIVLNGKMYVLGGYNNMHDTLKSAEVYDPKTNLWKMIPDMLFSDIKSVVIKDKCLYVIGGKKENEKMMVQSFDPVKYNWKIEEDIECGEIYGVKNNIIKSYNKPSVEAICEDVAKVYQAWSSSTLTQFDQLSVQNFLDKSDCTYYYTNDHMPPSLISFANETICIFPEIECDKVLVLKLKK